MDENNSEQSGGRVHVVDKRRFGADGEERPDQKEQLQEQQNSETSASRSRADHVEHNEEGVTFAAFVMGLATQTLALLGEIPNPENNLITVNIDAAHQIIDILDMLTEKTKGNLTPEETQLVDEVVHSLKVAFVRKVEEQNKGKL